MITGVFKKTKDGKYKITITIDKDNKKTYHFSFENEIEAEEMTNNIVKATERRLIENKVYRHFKGKDYLMLGRAIDTESGIMKIIYQGLYKPYDIYLRSDYLFSENIATNRPRFKILYE
jgi:hypothetical protein